MTTETDNQPHGTNCRVCVTPIAWVDCPAGGWWAHNQHPEDGHDAIPGAWQDGDPLMEAIAAGVWEHCNPQGTSVVVDDPRNIAATAAAVARHLIADAVVEWSGQQIGCHVPTVDAIVDVINPQPEPRVCGDRHIDWECSEKVGRHLDGKHRDEFNGAWREQSPVPPYSNRDRIAAEAEGGQR
ncbi:hypothetical protein M2164_005888 [Streptomyces sp. SAI-208]|uniref:hypothetical protein n=1 Tax=Streptomyces sp. SAI-208 TaxID=2940550 RepID=UPI0024760AED|nr:hypothetical protein [Streptomyces sp. SAI-208]MDH6610253.1 hypothetical protein [Streptomyces sp. SAI-208]